MYIGERIKFLREQNCYTQEKLEEITDIQKGTISKYENGHNSPSAENIEKIANAFNVSVDYLFGRDMHLISEDDEEYTKVVPNIDMQILNELHKPENEQLLRFLRGDPERRIKLIRDNNRNYFID